MTDPGPITKTLTAQILKVLDTVQDTPEILHVLTQVCSYFLNAIDQLEANQLSLAAHASKPLTHGLKILDETPDQTDDLTGDDHPSTHLTLDPKWDHRLAPHDLPRLHKRHVPRITDNTRPHWVPDNDLAIACAQAFNLPMPTHVGQEAGHVLTGRLTLEPDTGKIHFILGGYILHTLKDPALTTAKRHMTTTDSPCIEIEARLTRGINNHWRIIYYL